MALVLKDRVKEQTTTTGTGTVTLGGAISGFDTFASVGNGNTTYYAIVSQTADEWEVGLGTYTASGTTLSRDTVLESSNSDAAVNFSAGTKDVFVTYPADKSVYYNAAGTVNIDSLRLVAGVTVTSILDEDNMASNSATALSTQQSIKAYVDAQVDTTDTLAEVLAIGNTTGGTDLGVSAGDDVTFTDSSKAIFGAGSDLKIFHEGSNSYIQDLGTGGLLVEGSSVTIRNSGGTEAMASFTPDGAVSLYYNNAIKLATAATGVTMTGEVTATGFTGTLDGVLGGGTPAAATVTTLVANNTLGVGTSSISASTTAEVYGNVAGHVGLRVNNAAANGYATLWMSNATSNEGMILGGASAASFTDELAILTASATRSIAFYPNNAKVAEFDPTGLSMANAAGPSLLNEAATATNPTVLSNKADPDTGVGWVSANIGSLVAGGASTAHFKSGSLEMAATQGPALMNENASNTNPTLVPRKTDTGTGWGSNGTNNLEGIVASVRTVLFGASVTSFHNTGGSEVARIDRSTGNFQMINAAGPSLLQEAATATNPTIIPNKADPDTGVGWVSANIGSLVAGGASVAHFKSGSLEMAATYGPALVNAAPSSTAPSVLVGKTDTNTGLGSPTGDQLSLIAGGVEALRVYATYLDLNVTLQAANAAGPSLLNEAATATNPTIIPNKAAPTVGIGANSATTLSLIAAATEVVRLNSTTLFFKGSGGIECDNAAGAKLSNVGATATVPTLIPNKVDPDTGMGWVSADIGSLVAGGVEALRWQSSGVVSVPAALSFTDNNGPSWGSTWQTGNASSQFISFYINSALNGQVDATGVTVGNAAGPSLLNEAASATNPTLIPNKAAPTNGIGAANTNTVSLIAGGAEVFRINSTSAFLQGTALEGDNAAGPKFLNEAASATNPTFAPNKTDPDTGVGWVSANIGSLVAGGTNALSFSNSILAANVSFRFRSVGVSGLPGSATAGDTRYASDGRKAGEGSGSGTGVLAFYDGSNWIAVDTGATVAA